MVFLRTILTPVFLTIIFLSGQIFASKEQELKELYAKFEISEQFAQERLCEWANLKSQLEKLDALHDKKSLVTQIEFYLACENCDVCSARIARSLIRFMSQNPYEIHVTEDLVLQQIESCLEFHFSSEYSDEEGNRSDDACVGSEKFDTDFVSFHGDPSSPKNMGFLKHSAERKKYDKRKAEKKRK